jgi:hypothetical protein
LNYPILRKQVDVLEDPIILLVHFGNSKLPRMPDRIVDDPSFLPYYAFLKRPELSRAILWQASPVLDKFQRKAVTYRTPL